MQVDNCIKAQVEFPEDLRGWNGKELKRQNKDKNRNKEFKTAYVEAVQYSNNVHISEASVNIMVKEAQEDNTIFD